MNIVVCIKQVPNSAHVRIDPETKVLVREGVESIVNPYDMHALEAGLSLKERCGGKITVLTMGPPQAEAALREAISCGADEAVLLSDRAFAGSDTWATTYILSLGIKKIGRFDLIICGKQAIDGDTAQVGPGLAERLNIPYVTYVRRIESVENGTMRVQRLMDDGYDVLDLPLPALLTVVKELNEPRLPSLKAKIRAKSQQIPVYGAKELGADEKKIGLAGSFTEVTEIFAPKWNRKRLMIEGTVEEQVEVLLKNILNK
ncbi:MAG: electron transfer flavoprotein subunit beta/FixA family protein [Thermodesulfobacteriota bacterium]